MSPQRRTALTSIVAAAVLVGLKLATGLATGSLGLVSEAFHSAMDLVAAILTFFGVTVAGRPADTGHPYGHGKAEHLAALAEAAILVAGAIAIALLAGARLAGLAEARVDAALYAFAVLAFVIAIDVSRTVVSLRVARRYRSDAIRANALHFASDLAGSLAVLLGLVFTASGYPNGDSVAALVVAALVLAAGARLIRRNVDVLMDRAPDAAHEVARSAIAGLDPPVALRRLRLRQAAGRHFADVVIGVSPGDAIGQGHAAADAVEAAVQGALPGSDVIVHVEPLGEDAALRERVHAAALGVPRVREVHNVSVITVDGRTETSLHLKLPGELPLDEAHAVASRVEEAIRQALPGIADVRTHLEPLAELASGARAAGAAVERDAETVRRVVREATGREPRDLRFLETESGLVAFVTLGLEGGTPLAEAHRRASEVEERIRQERPGVADVIVHTEP